jgi:N utilization substance protein B
MSRRRKISDAQKRIAERRVARKLALFAIYQWQMTQHSLQEIYIQLQYADIYSDDFRKADTAFLFSLIKYALNNAKEIEALIQPHLQHRQLKQVDMIEQAVLRMATCELLNHTEIPYKVAVSEAVNITKKFGADQGHKFVNGVMTQLIIKLRSLEVSAEKPLDASPKVSTKKTLEASTEKPLDASPKISTKNTLKASTKKPSDVNSKIITKNTLKASLKISTKNTLEASVEAS